MTLSEVTVGLRVEYIDKLPDCVAPKGKGYIIGITAIAPIVQWDNGEVSLVYAEDLGRVRQ